MKGHRLHVRRKIIENEENMGLINEKDYVDQFMVFVQCSFGALIILSLSHTLGYLEFSWRTLGECGILGDLEQEGKGLIRKAQVDIRIRSYNGF